MVLPYYHASFFLYFVAILVYRATECGLAAVFLLARCYLTKLSSEARQYRL